MLTLHTCGTQIPSRHAANILLLDDAIWTARLSFFTGRKILGGRGREGKKNQLCTYMYAYFKQNYCFCLDKCSKSTKFLFRCSKIQNNCVKIVRFRLFIWEKTGTEKVRYKGSKTKGQKKKTRKRDNEACGWCTELFEGTYWQSCPWSLQPKSGQWTIGVVLTLLHEPNLLLWSGVLGSVGCFPWLIPGQADHTSWYHHVSALKASAPSTIS